MDDYSRDLRLHALPRGTLGPEQGAAVKVDSPEFKEAAGNITAAGAVSPEPFKIDKSAPDATFSDLPATVYYGSTSAKATCTAADSLSGPGTCVVSDYDTTTAGDKKLTATVTDMAGHTAEIEKDYTVLPWTAQGFYQPTDMNGVWNTVKGGSTVPVKFEVFAGETEITDPSKLALKVATVNGPMNSVFDEVETLVTGVTSLRYNTTGGQFIYNWKTPTAAGTGYTVTMTTPGGTPITANFKTK